jgi:DNA-binding MarR family transcriptional regulator
MGLIKNFISKEILQKIRISFRKVEDELNDHLDSINSNTNEIESLYELVNEINEKVEKLSSRIDALQLKIEPKSKKVIDFRVEPLTGTEKDIFFALYSAPKDLTYREIAKKTGVEDVMVQEYITSLIAKGIPLSKKFKNNQVLISIDKEFKEVQAKENLVKRE